MQPTLCARCHKNMAVVFINRIENGQSHQEGLCLKCARELHIKPIDDIISKMGINDEDLDGLSSEMMEAMQNLSGNGDDLMNIENDDDSSDDDGKTATFPFLNRLFGAQNAACAVPLCRFMGMLSQQFPEFVYFLTKYSVCPLRPAPRYCILRAMNPAGLLAQGQRTRPC